MLPIQLDVTSEIQYPLTNMIIKNKLSQTLAKNSKVLYFAPETFYRTLQNSRMSYRMQRFGIMYQSKVLLCRITLDWINTFEDVKTLESKTFLLEVTQKARRGTEMFRIWRGSSAGSMLVCGSVKTDGTSTYPHFAINFLLRVLYAKSERVKLSDKTLAVRYIALVNRSDSISVHCG